MRCMIAPKRTILARKIELHHAISGRCHWPAAIKGMHPISDQLSRVGQMVHLTILVMTSCMLAACLDKADLRSLHMLHMAGVQTRDHQPVGSWMSAEVEVLLHTIPSRKVGDTSSGWAPPAAGQISINLTRRATTKLQ